MSRFDRMMASPKQPQSVIGSAIHSHSVMAVISPMNAAAMRDTTLRCMANSRNMPRQNSSADSDTDSPSVTHGLAACSSPAAPA